MDQWEAEGNFPAHKVFKILGNAGFLGVTKPVGRLATGNLFRQRFQARSTVKRSKTRETVCAGGDIDLKVAVVGVRATNLSIYKQPNPSNLVRQLDHQV